MADSKLSALTEVSVPALDDLLYTDDISDTTDGAGGSSRKLTMQRLLGQMFPRWADGRLSAVTGVSDFAGWMAPQIPASTDTTGETVTFTIPHGLVSGSMVWTDVTVGGLTLGTTYFVNAASSTSISFHTTLAAALAGTSKVDLTASITGQIFPLGVQSGTLYYTPHVGTRISLYDGTRWRLYNFAEVSLALTITSGGNYDVFLYDNAGTLTLELSTIWTNDYTRANALTTQDGVTVKSGATTRRWLGTIRAVAANTIEDSLLHRFVWNAYNQLSLPMVAREFTSTWTYTIATVRQANGATTNQLEFVCGSPARFEAEVIMTYTNSSGNVAAAVGIGLDSTTQMHGINSRPGAADTVGEGETPSAFLIGNVAAGYHKLCWLEISVATGTTTWLGFAANVRMPGIIGILSAG